MKKTLTIMAAFLMSAVMAVPAFAGEETSSDDYEPVRIPMEIFDGRSEMYYDEDDENYWELWEGYIDSDGDRAIVIGISAEGYEDFFYTMPEIYSFVIDEQASDEAGERVYLGDVEEVHFVIGDKDYCYTLCKLDDYAEAYTIVYPTARELLKLIGETPAEEVGIIVVTTDDIFSIEHVNAEEYEYLKNIAAFMYEIDIWQYYDESFFEDQEVIEEMYGLTVLDLSTVIEAEAETEDKEAETEVQESNFEMGADDLLSGLKNLFE